jgi:penicillin amidase
MIAGRGEPVRRPISILLVILLAGCAKKTGGSLESRTREALSQLEGKIQLEGLAKPVEIRRDQWGVPHIYAQTVEDLFFAQGFVAAQDRLFQIDIWRRTGGGELAEILGERYLERDRFARLVKYRGEMAAEWASYSPDAKLIIESFVRGVNACIRRVGDRLPIEFQLLGARPGEWKPEDCLLRIAGLLMTRNAVQEVDRARLVASLGPEKAAALLPPDPPTKHEASPAFPLDGIDQRVVAALQAAIGTVRYETEPGSNNWVVDGTLSVTGKPILANDPHRPVVLPSLRYLTHLVGPGWNVIGAGEPALPGVALGHNERVGFGFTIVGIDQQDLYVESTDGANRYQVRGEWREMRIEREKIRVKGKSEPVEVELKFTLHGPVIYEDPGRKRAYALRWVGAEPGGAGYLGSLALARAQNWKEFVAALERWKVPSENLIYADVDGNIGWVAAGQSPLRKNWSGLLPQPGHTGEREWDGYLPLAEHPQKFNPPEHYIATANHNILPRGYRHQLGYDWNPGFRFRRIDEVLRARKKFTIEDFQRLQHDETSLVARELVAMLKQAPPGAGGEVRRMLENWDCVLDKNSAAAALYELWLRRLTARFIETLPVSPEARQVLDRRMNHRHVFSLLAKEPAEKRHGLLLRTLQEAAQEAEQTLGEETESWRWGALHGIRLRHPLSFDAERRKLFDLPPVERGGDANTVNNTGGSSFRQTSGASYRQILDLADWDRSVATSVPGQSGQPGSPHYADLLPLWADGKYFPLAYTRAAVEKYTRNILILEPK